MKKLIAVVLICLPNFVYAGTYAISTPAGAILKTGSAPYPVGAVAKVSGEIRLGWKNGSITESMLIIDNGVLRRKTEEDRTIEQWKAVVLAEIIAQTTTLTSQGFTSVVEGQVKTFKCELEDITTCAGYKAMQGNNQMVYPAPVRTLNEGAIFLGDVDTVDNWCGALLRRITAIKYADTQLQALLNIATTKEQILAIRDQNNART